MRFPVLHLLLFTATLLLCGFLFDFYFCLRLHRHPLLLCGFRFDLFTSTQSRGSRRAANQHFIITCFTPKSVRQYNVVKITKHNKLSHTKICPWVDSNLRGERHCDAWGHALRTTRPPLKDPCIRLGVDTMFLDYLLWSLILQYNNKLTYMNLKYNNTEKHLAIQLRTCQDGDNRFRSFRFTLKLSCCTVNSTKRMS